MTQDALPGPSQLVDQIFEMKRLLGQFAQLIEISLTLNSSLDREHILQSIIETASDVLECEAVSILLFDENHQELRFVASTDTRAEEIAKIPIPLENSIAGTIYATNSPQIINNLDEDQQHFQIVSDRMKIQNKSLVGVPMRIQDQVIGVIEGINKIDGEFTMEDVDILLVIANQAAVAINNARMLESLQAAYEELSRIDKIKSDFIAIASHELRTPLFHILGYAELLEQDAEGESAENLQHVLKSARLLQSLVDDMTNMNMLEARIQELKMENITIQEVLMQAYREIAPSAEDKHLKIDFSLPKSAVRILADKNKLQYVFTKVLNNAVQYTPEGGRIAVILKKQAEHITIKIQDTGIGIPPNQLEKIFDRFRQIEEHMTRTYGGLGLGLSIARGLVELHGGKIWAESEGKGQGTTIHITLPLEEPQSF